MSETESSSAEAPVAEVELDVEANAQVEDQTEGAEEGEGEGQAEDDAEEIEHEGQKYSLPKALAKEFREGILRQADYTRKTQEIAEQRRTVEARQAELQQQAEARKATLETRVSLAVLDQQLEQLNGMDWGAYAQQYGSDAAIAAMGQTSQLKAQRDALANEVTAKETEFVRASEQATANALREAEDVLSREVQGYGKELVGHVSQTAANFGFTAQELLDSFVGADGKPDTRTFKLLARLHATETELSTLKAKQTKAQTAEKVAAVKPAATVKPNGGQYKPGLDDSLPPEVWRPRREAQLAKAAKG